MKILIAEDDQVLADGLLRTLRKGGYAVEHVASGSEADAALADHEFDMVVLDLGLPKLHGLEVLRHIRADEAARGLPVVVLTSSERQEDREEALRLGASWFVCKPTDGRRLRSELQQLADHWARVTA